MAAAAVLLALAATSSRPKGREGGGRGGGLLREERRGQGGGGASQEGKGVEGPGERRLGRRDKGQRGMESGEGLLRLGSGAKEEGMEWVRRWLGGYDKGEGVKQHSPGFVLQLLPPLGQGGDHRLQCSGWDESEAEEGAGGEGGRMEG